MKTIVTVPERIDRILSDYANLEKYSHEMLDLAVEEMRLTDQTKPIHRAGRLHAQRA